MLRDNLSILHLKLLKSLFETNSLSATSANLRLSRPSASRTLQALRLIFDDELFVRKQGGLQPTPRMRELYMDACNVLDAHAQLFRGKSFDIQSLEATVRIAAQDNAVLSYLVTPISRIIQEHPKIHFRIEPFTHNSLSDLESGRISFAIFPVTSLPENFCSIVLDRTPRSVIVRKNHPLVDVVAKNGTLHSSQLSAYSRIRNSTRVELGSDIYNVPHVVKKSQNEAVITPYFISQATFLLQTDAFAFLPRTTAKLFQRFYPGRFKILPIQGEEGLILEPRLIWHRHTNRDPACQWIRSVIAAEQPPFDVALRSAPSQRNNIKI